MLKKIFLIAALTTLASGPAPSQTAGRFHRYYNKEFKVGFRYPTGWRLQPGESSTVEEAGFKALASVSVSEKSYPRTNFVEASATLAGGTLSEAACREFPSASESPKPHRRRVGNITFYTVTNSEGAAGHLIESKNYRTFHDGKCYQVTLMLNIGNIGNYDPGTVRAVNTRMIFNRLDTILRTFYFGG